MLAALTLLVAAEGPWAAGMTVARGGSATVPIFVAADAIPAETTAARELADYLERITGATFTISDEADREAGTPGIFVGATSYAAEHGLRWADLGSEEGIVRTVEASLLLTGGRPRGTLYAVYRFLEDTLQVRWWTPFSETVPRVDALSIPDLDLRSQPVFGYRDVAGIDGPRAFCARHRVNGHAARLTWAYGGTVGYGPPKQVHNVFLYVDPEEYFDSNPEFFSEIGGMRFGDEAQLCLTNPDLPEIVADKMLQYIRAARHAAEIRGVPAPQLFAFSQNDWGKACRCATCESVAADHGGHASAPLIQFVNRVADLVRPHYPDVILDTLAYSFTFDPPENLVARENVVVRLSALYHRDYAKGILHPVNKAYREALAAWQEAAPNLRIWDYTVIFGPDGDLPLPNLSYLASDLRTYRDHGVDGLFVQHAHPIGGDLRDLKLWVLLKLLEDPARDPAGLIATFTDGYYGAAGKIIRRYLELLESRAAEADVRIDFFSDHEAFRYIDEAFARRAHKLFDRAEKRVRDDPERLQRVRHARLSLDRATLLRGLTGVDRAAVARRYKAVAQTTIDERADASAREALKDAVDAEIARYLLE